MTMQEAATRRFKGKYAGPDKYKGVVPDKLKKKYKGKYFGKDSNKGSAFYQETENKSRVDLKPKLEKAKGEHTDRLEKQKSLRDARMKRQKEGQIHSMPVGDTQTSIINKLKGERRLTKKKSKRTPISTPGIFKAQ